MTNTVITPKITIPLEGCVTGGANIEILRAETRADIRSPLALIRYSDHGRETKYGVCLDLDKKVFIDHLPDVQQEHVLQQLAPELADLLNHALQEVRYRQLGYVPQAAVSPTSSVGGQKLNVVEEELAVGKRQVQSGGVRVYSHVTEKPVEASVNLREEHVTVERHAVNRPVDANAFNTLKEGVIEVTETAEVPVVAKEARIVEEVSAGETIMTDTRMTPMFTIKLEDSISGGDDIEILRAEIRTDVSSALALIHYSEHGREPQYGLRLDLDKRVFIDHLADVEQESFMQRIAPEIAAIINDVRRETFYQQEHMKHTMKG